MAKITRIKAKDPGKPSEKAEDTPVRVSKVKVGSGSPKSKDTPKKASKVAKKAVKKAEEPKKTAKKPFILFRPFVALGRYVRESWQEIRKVRWPSRKATWKLVLAIFVYTAIFITIIMLLDALFTWIFGLILG